MNAEPQWFVWIESAAYYWSEYMPIKRERLKIMVKGLDHPGAIAIERSGNIWAGGEAGQLYRISPSGKKVEHMATAGGPVTCLALAPSGTWMAVGDRAGGLVRLDLATMEMKPIPEFSGVAGGACFFPDGRLLVTERSDPKKGRLLLFDLPDPMRELKVGPLADPCGLALNAECTSLFIACRLMPGILLLPVEMGIPTRAQPFVKMRNVLPEAIVMDHRSNLYIGCHSPTRIFKVAPDKWVTVHIEDLPMEVLSQPVGLAWTGKGFDFIIAANRGGHHLTSIDMRQVGLGTVNQR